ncbi:MAG: flagellar hook basal-body protein [Sedimentisphaerales bacterium]|nr:flagellar hook basal-body protein [Sedimentisphaerales bacterium]
MSELNPIIGSNIDLLTRRFEQIAHNLANVNTAGFKRYTSHFMQVLTDQLGQEGQPPSAELTVKEGIDFSQAHLDHTGRNLDLAIVGRGFFILETPSGPLYTRHGIFYLNQNGQITDSQGRILAGEAGPIVVPLGMDPTKIQVASDGTISVGQTKLGRIRIADFGDQQGRLIPAGDCCFAAPDNLAPISSQEAQVKQGFLEASNVQAIQELVDMITVSRLYETNMRFLTANRDTSKSIIDVAMG